MTSGDNDTILDRLVDILAANGSVPKETKDRLTLEALAEVIRLLKQLEDIPERVSKLEEHTIYNAFWKHPKTFLLLVFMSFVILNYVAHSITPDEWLVTLPKLLGVP